MYDVRTVHIVWTSGVKKLKLRERKPICSLLIYHHHSVRDNPIQMSAPCIVPAVLVYLLAVSSSAAVRTARDFNLWQIVPQQVSSDSHLGSGAFVLIQVCHPSKLSACNRNKKNTNFFLFQIDHEEAVWEEHGEPSGGGEVRMVVLLAPNIILCNISI